MNLSTRGLNHWGVSLTSSWTQTDSNDTVLMTFCLPQPLTGWFILNPKWWIDLGSHTVPKTWMGCTWCLWMMLCGFHWMQALGKDSWTFGRMDHRALHNEHLSVEGQRVLIPTLGPRKILGTLAVPAPLIRLRLNFMPPWRVGFWDGINWIQNKFQNALIPWADDVCLLEDSISKRRKLQPC